MCGARGRRGVGGRLGEGRKGCRKVEKWGDKLPIFSKSPLLSYEVLKQYDAVKSKRRSMLKPAKRKSAILLWILLPVLSVRAARELRAQSSLNLMSQLRYSMTKRCWQTKIDFKYAADKTKTFEHS